MKDSVTIANQASAFHSDPERIVARYRQAKNVVIAEGGSVFAIEGQEPFTIEAHKPARSTDPQISVVRLSKRLHDLLRQAILHLPEPRSVGKWWIVGGKRRNLLEAELKEEYEEQHSARTAQRLVPNANRAAI